jgi:hypothetical protein
MRLSTFQTGGGKLQGGAGQKYLSGMSNFDQTCEPYGADPRTTLGYKRCACQPGSWWEADVRVKERDVWANGLHQARPGCEAELTRTFEQEVVPLFRRVV